jgi:hypothetical protein
MTTGGTGASVEYAWRPSFPGVSRQIDRLIAASTGINTPGVGGRRQRASSSVAR